MPTRTRLLVLHFFVSIATALTALSEPVPASAQPPTQPVAGLLKLDGSIRFDGEKLKVEQTGGGGIRLSGANAQELEEVKAIYLTKTLPAPAKADIVRVGAMGAESAMLVIVTDDNGSTTHRHIRPETGDDTLDLIAMPFAKDGKEAEFSGKVQKVSLTIPLPKSHGEFEIEINELAVGSQ
ncbi:MAG: hypothetical protein WC003_15455 [Terrimicrobiaceae bacterium]